MNLKMLFVCITVAILSRPQNATGHFDTHGAGHKRPYGKGIVSVIRHCPWIFKGAHKARPTYFCCSSSVVCSAAGNSPAMGQSKVLYARLDDILFRQKYVNTMNGDSQLSAVVTEAWIFKGSYRVWATYFCCSSSVKRSGVGKTVPQ